jgi:hypothetical protein
LKGREVTQRWIGEHGIKDAPAIRMYRMASGRVERVSAGQSTNPIATVRRRYPVARCLVIGRPRVVILNKPTKIRRARITRHLFERDDSGVIRCTICLVGRLHQAVKVSRRATQGSTV